ncbi:phage portal protein [Bacillaceae bacterium JMAK1]|nr:phage portal protein [Bacillaceae bacterium JMAK1]
MGRILNAITGEMSRFRDNMTSFGINLIGGMHRPYTLDSRKTDYTLTKELYDNTNDDYKLGGGFVKPVVNTSASFMGVPKFHSQDEDAEEVLKSFVERNRSKMLRTERNALRDGDCYIWITREENQDTTLFPEEKDKIVYNVLPPGQVKDIILDPITHTPIEYQLESNEEWIDDSGYKRQFVYKQRILAGKRIVEVDGDAPVTLELGEIESPWDFLPIVHFKNESDESEKFGKSEVESIEPYIKAYHDVMYHAMQGSKMNSTPKLKLKVKDVKGFLKNNFAIDNPAEYARKHGSISLDGKELLLLGEEEDAGFVEAESPTGDAKLLLQLLFYCIVDASETPEFVFGVHTPSSHASTKEQMPVLVRKVQRKRDQFAEPFQRIARIVLAMTHASENKAFSTFATELEWEEVDPRDTKEEADEIEVVVRSLSQAVTTGLTSIDAAVDFLARYIDTMDKYEGSEDSETKEKDKLMRTKLLAQGLEDTQLLEDQRRKILELQNGRGDS